MPEAPAYITVKVKADIDVPAIKTLVSGIVFQYSEWLDSEGLVVGDDQGDNRSHQDLVEDFFIDYSAQPEIDAL